MFEHRNEVNKYFINLLNKIEETDNGFFNLLTELNRFEQEEYFLENFDKVEELKDKLNLRFTKGTTKFVIICDDNDKIAQNYVLKIPFLSSINWCEEEVNIYNNIYCNYKKYVDYFCECWEVGKYKNIPLYIMRRADTDSNYVESFYSEKENSEIDGFSGSDDVYECFIDYYGEDDIIDLNQFLIDYCIYDIHSDNVGFINKKPMFIDYSGC